jgi:hypothetical protein
VEHEPCAYGFSEPERDAARVAHPDYDEYRTAVLLSVRHGGHIRVGGHGHKVGTAFQFYVAGDAAGVRRVIDGFMYYCRFAASERILPQNLADQKSVLTTGQEFRRS